LADETMTGIFKERDIKRDFSWEAQKVTRFLKAVTHKFRHFPVAIVGTNHNKPTVDPHTYQIKNHVTGGFALRFQNTIEFILKKTGNGRRSDHAYNTIMFETDKNSMGKDHSTIIAEIRWYDLDPVTEQQVCYWDWDTATVNMLMGKDRAPSDKHFGGVKSKLDAAIDITGLRDSTQGRVWSNTLGVSSGDPIAKDEMGKIINNNEELKKMLRPILGIRTHGIFESCIPYSRQANVTDDPDANE